MRDTGFAKCPLCGGKGRTISSAQFGPRANDLKFGPESSCPACQGSGYSAGWAAHEAVRMRAELDALRAAGDALADAVRRLAVHEKDLNGYEWEWQQKGDQIWGSVHSALAGWAAARGGSGSEATPESEDNS